MATIVYSREKKDPENIYLPLEHGGYIMLIDGSHTYPNHAGYGLKNSTNPTVRHYLSTGKVNVIMDDDSPIAVGMTGYREFAPLDATDYKGIQPKITYAPISESQQVQITKPEEPTEKQPRSRKTTQEQE